MTILYINRSDSRCGGCRKSCLPREETHTTPCGYDQHAGCGARYTQLSTDYSDFEGFYDIVKSMRPDLEWIGGPFGIAKS